MNRNKNLCIIIIIFLFTYIQFLYAEGGPKPDFYIDSEKAFIVNLNVLYCIDLNSHKNLWTFSPKLHVASQSGLEKYLYAGISSFLVDKGIVYLASDEGYLYALDCTSGNINWEINLKVTVITIPVIKNDKMYFGSSGRIVNAFDLVSKKVLWTFKANGDITNSLAMGEYLYFGSKDMNFYAVDYIKGKREWNVQTRGEVLCNPLVTEDRMYIGCKDGTVYQIKPSNGGVFWQTSHYKKYGEEINPILVKGNLIFKNSDSIIAVVSVKRLEGLFGFLGNNIQANTMITQDSLLYYHHDGVLSCGNAVSGYPQWNLNTGDTNISVPVLQNNNFYYTCNGILNKIDLNKKIKTKIFEFTIDSLAIPKPITEEGTNAVFQNIIYTEEAQNNGAFGKVIINLLVDENLKVVSKYISFSDHPLLSEIVENALNKMEMKPGFLPVNSKKVWIYIPFSFKMQ